METLASSSNKTCTQQNVIQCQSGMFLLPWEYDSRRVPTIHRRETLQCVCVHVFTFNYFTSVDLNQPEKDIHVFQSRLGIVELYRTFL